MRMQWRWDVKVGRRVAISSHQSNGRKSRAGLQRLDGRRDDQKMERPVRDDAWDSWQDRLIENEVSTKYLSGNGENERI